MNLDQAIALFEQVGGKGWYGNLIIGLATVAVVLMILAVALWSNRP